MTIEIVDQGRNNVLDVDPKFLEIQSGKIIFSGDDNTLRIGEGCAMRGGQIQIWNGSKVEIGSGCLLGFIDIFANRGAKIQVGKNVGFTWTVKLHAHEFGILTVGDECLIAKDSLITISDMHSIIDLRTKERINPAANVSIGKRVWLAENVRVLKGVVIGDGSIIGTCSVVTKDIPPESLAIGTPARVVRDGVTWSHELI